MADRNIGDFQDNDDAAEHSENDLEDEFGSTENSDSDYQSASEHGSEELEETELEERLESLLEVAENGVLPDEDGNDPGDDQITVRFLTPGPNGVPEEQRVSLSVSQLRRLVQLSAGGRARFLDELGGEGEEDNDLSVIARLVRGEGGAPPPDPNRFPKVPSEAGAALMDSGIFGSDEAQSISSGERNNMAKKKKLARRILDRELAISSPTRQKLNQRLMAQGMIPSSNPDMIINYDHPAYSGQFSDDGNFFFSANQDYRVRMYDTSNPYKWRYYKTVRYFHGEWTLTDATLSPDNKYLAYTSIRHTVCLAPTDPNDQGEPYVLDFTDTGAREPLGQHSRFQRAFGIWSIRYSGDGRQLVAGTNGGSIITYDIESRRATNRIFGHTEDVNAVCFADSSSPHILYSGSDDTTLKVWDTRSMGDNRAAGAFVGHIEGLTYIDSKGDGRYILSNGKDQSMKLWDLRMVMPNGEFERINPKRRVNRVSHFDYRWGNYDENDWYKDPYDNSLVTFRGHKVLRTLIRCHFSPPASTNSRYVYSGSEDGKVYIWNMDATPAGVIDVYGSTKNTRPRGDDSRGIMGDWEEGGQNNWKTCVRDAAWHPNAPMIVASAWNGYGMGAGTCTAHSWNDGAEDDEAEPKMGLRVDEKLNVDEDYYRVVEEPIREEIDWGDRLFRRRRRFS